MAEGCAPAGKTERGVGTIYCLAGIGAHENVMIDTAKAAVRVIAIDGCPVACSKKTLEHAGIIVTDWICVTGEGIAKNKDFSLPAQDIELIVRCARESLAKPV